MDDREKCQVELLTKFGDEMTVDRCRGKIAAGELAAAGPAAKVEHGDRRPHYGAVVDRCDAPRCHCAERFGGVIVGVIVVGGADFEAHSPGKLRRRRRDPYPTTASDQPALSIRINFD